MRIEQQIIVLACKQWTPKRQFANRNDRKRQFANRNDRKKEKIKIIKASCCFRVRVVTMAMSESERRSSAKLHKQPEVEDDDGDEAQHQHQGQPDTLTPGTAQQPQLVADQGGTDIGETSNGGSASTQAGPGTLSDSSTHEAGVNISGVRTPTIQSASSSSETSPDEAHTQAPITPAFTRKQTLTRTQALEGTSPPPESLPNQQCHAEGRASSLDVPGHSLTNGGGRGSSEALTGQVSGSATSQSLLQKKGSQSASQEAKDSLLASQKVSNDSGHGTLDTTDAGSDTSVLSRDSSLENSAANLYKDSSGVNIPQFIRETMLKSAKDKKTVLAYEKQLIDFCRNDESHVLKMAEASSYDRMIAHRLSAFMGLEHNVDSTGKAVIINKTENMRILKITDLIKLDDQEQETKKKILLKKPASLDEKHSRGAGKGHFGSHRAKSLEERQQIYSEARERIFKDGENQGDTLNPPSLLTTHCSMPQLHHQRSLDSARPSCSVTSTSPVLPSAATTPPSSQSHYPPARQHHLLHHHHLLHPAHWSSVDSAPGASRSGQGAADLRASTMIKSNSYGGVGSNPSVMPGLLGSELGPGAISGYGESPKQAANVYSHPPNPGGMAPPPLCPSLPGTSTERPPSQQTPSEESQHSVTPGTAQQQQGQQQQQQPHHHHQQQQQQQVASPACPNPSVAYLISSDYTSIPAGSLIIDPNTMQPHVNADGSLYRFNPTCPPPFMSQPVVQPSPPAGQLSYQMENLSVSEVSGKFSAAGLEAAPGVAGQLVMSHPQAALSYPSSHPIQFPQGQYYPSVSPSPVSLPGQPPFQVLTYAPAAPPVASGVQVAQMHPQQQILQPSPLETQGQTTVPMPAVGVPGVPANLGGATAYVLGPSPYDIGGTGPVTMYTSYPPGVEALGVGTPIPQQQHPQLVQYNIAAAAAAYGQPQPHLHHHQQSQPQVVVPHSPAAGGHAAYFTAVQAPPSSSTPTPPPPHHMPGIALSQLPPPPTQQIPVPLKASSQTHSLQHSQHQQLQQQQQHGQQQQQQPTVFYGPGLSNLTVSPLTPVFPSPLSSNPQPAASIVMAPPSSTSSIAKAGQPPYVQYHSSPPPAPPTSHHALHAHNQQNLNQQHHQVAVAAAAPSNGHHSHHHTPSHQQQLTLSCSGQPLSFCPTSSSGSSTVPRGGPMPQQLVAYHPMRPVGTIVHLGGGPSVQPLAQPTPVGPTQLQPYQIIRPTGPELRMMNHGSIRPRLTSLQFSSPHGQQAHPKSSNRQSKKGSKRNNSEAKEADDVLFGGGEGGGSSLRTPQSMLGSASAASQPQYPHNHQQQQPLQQQPHQQPVLVTPVLPGMVGHPHIPAQAPSHTR
ncbi:R3H domain-containing protein 1 [Elysia marginata]|uniref:R3H domain-containing protein 1 n=1 Tax=Elysia marginata TaxID=1093978 RepID=A0AAV4EML8_9GAST|nr:R3H domain-containing protein 1 [Elysia marginata]